MSCHFKALAAWLLFAGSAACPAAAPSLEALGFTCHGDDECAHGYVCVEARCVLASQVYQDAAASAVDVGARDAMGTDRPAVDRPAAETSIVDVTPRDAHTDDGWSGDVPAADRAADDAGGMVDADRDGGSTDSAATVDAGADAGMSDLGSVDLASPDGEEPDRAEPDGAELDGQSDDSASVDHSGADRQVQDTWTEDGAADAAAGDTHPAEAATEDAQVADAAPRCDDQQRNGDETDTDCGGPDCLPCGEGSSCDSDDDCSTGFCLGLTCQPPQLGTGADGPVTFSVDTRLDIDTTIAGRICADGGDAVAYSVVGLGVDSAVLLDAPATGCLVPGDEVLLINLQGTATASANTGTHETLRVLSVSTSVVTLASPKLHFYGDAAGGDDNLGVSAGLQRVVLQRVPQYTTVTVADGAVLTASAWDGNRGGVVFFRATGDVEVKGTIRANQRGFRGGVAGGRSPEGEQGSASLGGGGGGGGSGGHNGSNACGVPGAGADGAQDGYCGIGGDYYHPCTGYASMCSTKGCGGDGLAGGGGGGAGYGYTTALGGSGSSGGGDGGDKAANVGGNGVTASAAGCAGGGGSAGRDSGGGGGGGRPLSSLANVSSADLTRVLPGGGSAAGGGGGGGGGAGDFTCAQGGSGGARSGAGGARGTDSCGAGDSTSGQAGGDGTRGGGILAIHGRRIVVTGFIGANGGPGGEGGDGGRGAAIGACSTGYAAGGGGGGGGGDGAAGGTILLWAHDVDLGTERVTALGGAGGGGGVGGLGNGGMGGASAGAGGGGAGGNVGVPGAIAISYRDAIAGTTSPAAVTSLH